MADEKRRVTLDQWQVEGRRLYGPNVADWKLRCPSCGKVQSPTDWRLEHAPLRDIDRQFGFSCIGRFIISRRPDANSVVGFGDPDRGDGCDYAGGGLFRINPVEVIYGDFKDTKEPAIRPTFEWADPLPEEAK